MKSWITTGCIVLGSLWPGLAPAQAPDLSKMDIVERSTPAGPVAAVNGACIDREEYLRTYQKHIADVVRMTGQKKITDEFCVRAGLTTLGELIRREILVQEAQKRKVVVSEAEVEKAFQEKMKRFREEMKKEGGAMPSEEEVLKLAGQTSDEARASLRRQLIEDKMIDVLAKEKKVIVTDKEVSDFFKSKPELFRRAGGMHLQQILIRPKPTPAKADENAWKASMAGGDKARARVLAGESFGAVARAMSEAPDAAEEGDLGMAPVGQLPPFFVEVAKTLQPGEVSKPFRSEYGVHVIRLVETADAQDVPLEEAKPKIQKTLLAAKTEEVVDKFIEPIVNDPKKTQIYLQLERTLAAMGVNLNQDKPAARPTADKPVEKSADKSAAVPAKATPTAKPAADKPAKGKAKAAPAKAKTTTKSNASSTKKKNK